MKNIENIQGLIKINYQSIDSLSTFFHYDEIHGNICNVIISSLGNTYLYQSDKPYEFYDLLSFSTLWVNWKLDKIIEFINTENIIKSGNYEISKDGVLCNGILFKWLETSTIFDGHNVILINDFGYKYSVNYLEDEYAYIITCLLRPDSNEQVRTVIRRWLENNNIEKNNEIELNEEAPHCLKQKTPINLNNILVANKCSGNKTEASSLGFNTIKKPIFDSLVENSNEYNDLSPFRNKKNKGSISFWKKVQSFFGIEVTYDKNFKNTLYGSERDEVILRSLDMYTSSSHSDRFCIYHIYKTKGDLSTGYIGVTSNFDGRKYNHFTLLKNSIHENRRLQCVFDNQEIDENNMVIIESGLTEIEAYQREAELRPNFHMGWNINKGGKNIQYIHPNSRRRNNTHAYVDADPLKKNIINLYSIKKDIKELSKILGPSSMNEYLKEIENNNDGNNEIKNKSVTNKDERNSKLDDLMAEYNGNPFEAAKRIKGTQIHNKNRK